MLLATSYAIACLFLRDGDSSATIDTEVVYRPSRAKSLGNCFELKGWCENMLSIAAVGVALKYSTKPDSGLVRFKISSRPYPVLEVASSRVLEHSDAL